MRSGLLLSLVVAASAKDVPGRDGLLTTGVATRFMKESILLSKDLTVYTVGAAGNAVWKFVPADQQKLISTQWTTVWDQVETMRLQNGLMKPSDLYDQGVDAFTGKVVPAVHKAYELVTKAAEKPFGFIKTHIKNFEAEYPEHAGLLSGVSIWDFVLTVGFIVYFVLGYSKKLFCYVFCCGFCAKRAPSSPQLIKKQAPPLKSNGISKKR